jgi:hypothetical protein
LLREQEAEGKGASAKRWLSEEMAAKKVAHPPIRTFIFSFNDSLMNLFIDSLVPYFIDSLVQ